MSDILQESFESYTSYINNLPNASLHIAELIRNEGLISAINLIRQFSEGMIWVIEMNVLLVKNNIVPKLEIEELKKFLQEITDALEVQDYVLLADLFQYEIAPFFEEYISIENNN